MKEKWNNPMKIVNKIALPLNTEMYLMKYINIRVCDVQLM